MLPWPLRLVMFGLVFNVFLCHYRSNLALIDDFCSHRVTPVSCSVSCLRKLFTYL